MRSVRVLSALSFGLSYALMRLRRSAPRRSRRVPERVVEKHIVEKLSMFSRALPTSPFLFYSCDLYSISFSRGAIQEKSVSSWYQNMAAFYSSAHLDFKCKCILRLKKDATKGLEKMRIPWDFGASRFATPYPIYLSGCSKSRNVTRYRGVWFPALDALTFIMQLIKRTFIIHSNIYTVARNIHII